jgi:hypothetical protein
MNRYQYIQTETDPSTKVKMYKNSKYPLVPVSPDDIYVITTFGDRLDLLAQQYYNDSTLWWVISIANDFLKQDSIFIPIGTQIRIPINVNSILTSYRNLNS